MRSEKQSVLTENLDIAQLKTACKSVLYCDPLARHRTIEAVDYILRLTVGCRAISTQGSRTFSIHITVYKDLYILPEKSTTYKQTTLQTNIWHRYRKFFG